MYSESFKYTFHFDITSQIIVTQYLCVYRNGELLAQKALYERWYTPYNSPSELPGVGEQLANILWTQSVVDEYKAINTESDAYQDVDSYGNVVESETSEDSYGNTVESDTYD